MDLRHVVSFLALADELHFGRAAARLHVSQPTLSQHLQRLERSIGVELVARTSHEVRLTAAGRVFRERAEDIMARVERAGEAARTAAAGRLGTVRVGYNLPAGQRVLPGTLARFNTRHPGADVEMVELRTGPQLAALADGRLDVAMVYGRPTTRGLRSRPLMRVPLVAVVGMAHRWAGRAEVPFRALDEETCILFHRDQSSAMYDAIQSAARTSGIELNVAEEVDDPGATAIIAAVRPVVGFASAVRGRLAGTAGGPRTTAVRLYDPVPILDLYAVWNADHEPLVAAFLRCLPEPGSLQP
ncbi:LysR family transcriptional regulator [Thermomonospora umbrina]|uniref:DNA-binding transcriptional LysR family regulator n=1 Tax=Thermomonospora umbrina TaxID=111806 RepID=A0A3D9SYL1_9ACTN|nr:LysR family transcriptional regulator [Thermomonospora umbrina]REE97654.1 DNA-binding transcriptional LysR family regulator [Thermomonospora umbrina]